MPDNLARAGIWNFDFSGNVNMGKKMESEGGGGGG